MHGVYQIRIRHGVVEIRSHRKIGSKNRGLLYRTRVLKGITEKRVSEGIGRRYFSLTDVLGKKTVRSAAYWALITYRGEPPEGKPFALHRDGDHENDSISNLYFGDRIDNARDAKRHRRRS